MRNRLQCWVFAATLAVAVAIGTIAGSGVLAGITAADCAPGEHALMLGNGRRAHMLVTPRGDSRERALIVVLHGAGDSSRDGLWAFRGGWRVPGIVMVAPSARGSTWSVLHGTDEDLPVVSHALARAYARCSIDRRRIGVGGFSDGATYALSRSGFRMAISSVR